MSWGIIMTVIYLLGMYACWMYSLRMDEDRVSKEVEEFPPKANSMKQAA